MPVEEGEFTSDTSIATFTNYLWTIIYMPMSLRVLCLTNLFCWMSLVCYSLYFTDFVGEAVFKGDPSASLTILLMFSNVLRDACIAFRLLLALKNGGCMMKEFNLGVGEWLCTRCRAHFIPLPLKNSSKNSGTCDFIVTHIEIFI